MAAARQVPRTRSPRKPGSQASRAVGEGTANAIGVDTGGTFTDVVAWRGGERVAFKVPSTPREPAPARA